MILTLKLVAGFILLLLGGETMLKGAVGTAKQLKVSPLMIGIVLVGFGTSLPELVTCLQAALKGAPDIATGNIIGSNIANVLLIVGIAALLMPVDTPIGAFKRDNTALILTTLLFTVVCLSGTITRPVGAVFVLIVVLYVVVTYRLERGQTRDAEKKRQEEEMEIAEPTPQNLINGLLMALGGIAIVLYGAKLLVEGATDLARLAGISEAVIGLTIVAVGTSLPELATAVIAGLKKHGDISVGNIIGSNIFNLMGIAGTTALVTPLSLPEKILSTDLWIMAGTTILLVIMTLTGEKVSRREGGLLLGLYAVYLGSQFLAG